MKYFVDAKGTIYAYESDGSQDEFIKEGLTPVTEAEVKERLKPSAECWQRRAESKRESLISEAGRNLSVNQVRLLSGRVLSERESQSLNAWLDYVDALEAMTFAAVVDEESYLSIKWPEKPA